MSSLWRAHAPHSQKRDAKPRRTRSQEHGTHRAEDPWSREARLGVSHRAESSCHACTHVTSPHAQQFRRADMHDTALHTPVLHALHLSPAHGRPVSSARCSPQTESREWTETRASRVCRRVTIQGTGEVRIYTCILIYIVRPYLRPLVFELNFTQYVARLPQGSIKLVRRPPKHRTPPVAWRVGLVGDRPRASTPGPTLRSRRHWSYKHGIIHHGRVQM